MTSFREALLYSNDVRPHGAMSGMDDRDSWSTYESGPTLSHSFALVVYETNIRFEKKHTTRFRIRVIEFLLNNFDLHLPRSCGASLCEGP